MEQETKLIQQIETLKEQIEVLNSNLFNICANLHLNTPKENCTKDIEIAQCMIQMARCKINSILVLSAGVPFVPQQEKGKVLDIPSMFAIKRSLFELVFTYHNIFIMTDTDNEKQILLNLWKIRGFNNRQNITWVSEEQMAQQRMDKQNIETLRQETFDIISRMNASKEAKMQLEKSVKNNSSMFKVCMFQKENGKIVSFQEKPLSTAAKVLFKDDKVGQALYPLLSLHTHFSYLGVLQFGQMFKNGQDKHFLKTILEGVCLLSAFLIDDVNKNIKDGKLSNNIR